MKRSHWAMLGAGALALVIVAIWLSRNQSSTRTAADDAVVSPETAKAPASTTPTGETEVSAKPMVAEPAPQPVVTVAKVVPSAPPPTAVGTSTAASTTAPTPGARPATGESAEVLATRRMYGAHAPLREAEIADPDSAANRQILQTMVQKALARASAEAAPATSNP